MLNLNVMDYGKGNEWDGLWSEGNRWDELWFEVSKMKCDDWCW